MFVNRGVFNSPIVLKFSQMSQNEILMMNSLWTHADSLSKCHLAPTGYLRNLYAGQETTVRTGHGTMDWFKIGKRVHQGCVLSLCLFKRDRMR